MRQKDSIVNENLVLTKLVEKQQKAVEAANDVKHSVGTQVVGQCYFILNQD